jgi:hypothetical protein
MKDKKISNSSYILVNMSREERDDTISNEKDETMLWEKHFVTIKLINVITTRDHEFTTNNVLQDQPRYYVSMHKKPIVTNLEVVTNSTNMVMNIDEPTLKGKVKIKNVEHLNQGTLSTCHIHLQEG